MLEKEKLRTAAPGQPEERRGDNSPEEPFPPLPPITPGPTTREELLERVERERESYWSYMKLARELAKFTREIDPVSPDDYPVIPGSLQYTNAADFGRALLCILPPHRASDTLRHELAHSAVFEAHGCKVFFYILLANLPYACTDIPSLGLPERDGNHVVIAGAGVMPIFPSVMPIEEQKRIAMIAVTSPEMPSMGDMIIFDELKRKAKRG